MQAISPPNLLPSSFFLSNSSDSNEEKFVIVNSTLEQYQFEPVGASTSHALTTALTHYVSFELPGGIDIQLTVN